MNEENSFMQDLESVAKMYEEPHIFDSHNYTQSTLFNTVTPSENSNMV